MAIFQTKHNIIGWFKVPVFSDNNYNISSLFNSTSASKSNTYNIYIYILIYILFFLLGQKFYECLMTNSINDHCYAI